MSDIVFIRELTVKTIIGIHDWEQQVPQKLSLDLEFAADAINAKDNINNVIDYNQVSVWITEYLANNKFKLIETLADNLANLLQQEFNMQKLKLTIRKIKAIPNAQCVGVTIERGK